MIRKRGTRLGRIPPRWQEILCGFLLYDTNFSAAKRRKKSKKKRFRMLGVTERNPVIPPILPFCVFCAFLRLNPPQP
jgi:hypothetical protein